MVLVLVGVLKHRMLRLFQQICLWGKMEVWAQKVERSHRKSNPHFVHCCSKWLSRLAGCRPPLRAPLRPAARPSGKPAPSAEGVSRILCIPPANSLPSAAFAGHAPAPCVCAPAQPATHPLAGRVGQNVAGCMGWKGFAYSSLPCVQQAGMHIMT